MMLLMPHELDPNVIEWVHEREHYIYGDDYGNTATRVDAEDYQFFSRWRWNVRYDKHGRKIYFVRTHSDRTSGERIDCSVYLHVAIQERADPVRPAGHSMVDHENGNSLECRRFNLRYATPSMNRRNIQGQRSMRI